VGRGAPGLAERSVEWQQMHAGERIPVLRPRLPDADALLPYLRRIDTSRQYTNWGPLALAFEARVAAMLGCDAEAIVSASSGTAALVGAILATTGRPPPGTTAIVPAFTFVATALAAEQAGYRPHFVDVAPGSWALEPELIGPGATPGDLVIPVAPFGRAVAQHPWAAFQRRTGHPVVIDGGASFEALAREPGHFVGDVPVALSFHATKSFSAAEGGCVVTTDRTLARRVREALNFGFFDARNCVRASTNGKLSEYHAAVGLASADAWSETHVDLMRLAEGYTRRMAAVGLGARMRVLPHVAGCYVLYDCTDTAEASSLVQSLAAANVETRSWYGEGLHRHTWYATRPHGPLPVTEDLAARLVALPVAPDIGDAALDRIVSAVAQGAAVP
jgi:dTDP-4-amino-4,6-dideoxygalactose transaminase